MSNESTALISVIVPIYNLAESLPRCIASVLSQSYTHFELILVDDGSTDESALLAAEYAQKDARIRLIEKENGGVGSARNAALAAADGAYIVFLDGDDCLAEDALATLLRMHEEQPAAFAVAERSLHSVDGEQRERRAGAVRQLLTQREALFDLCEGRYCLQSVCHKLFSRELMKGLSFDESISHGEDRLFMYWYIKRVEKLYYLPQALWQVWERPNSASREPLNAKWMSMIEVMDRLIDAEADEQLKRQFRIKRMELLSLYIAAYINRNSRDQAFFQKLRQLSRQGLREYAGFAPERKDLWNARFYAYLPAGLLKAYQCLRKQKI